MHFGTATNVITLSILGASRGGSRNSTIKMMTKKKRKSRCLLQETGVIGKVMKNRVMLESQPRKYLLSIAGHVLTAISATLRM